MDGQEMPHYKDSDTAGIDARNAVANAIKALHDAKPNDRSEKDRHCAIAITEAEKLIAYIAMFIE